MEKSMGTRGQMSEAVSTGIFLTLSGGFQDAYTYYCRGNVFANAQTGNIVLMGSHLAAREWNLAVRYLAPVLAFAGGVYMAEHVKRLHRQDRRFHWRQLIVAIEIILLFVVGFLPQDMNMAANIIVSFVCALQVNAFRKIKGSPYATTMCIGNLRSGTAALSAYMRERKPRLLRQALCYFAIIFLFAIGAGIGGRLSMAYGERAIWVSSILLLISFLLMFIEEIEEAEHRWQ